MLAELLIMLALKRRGDTKVTLEGKAIALIEQFYFKIIADRTNIVDKEELG